MSDEHRHNFEAKYKRARGKMEIENPCKCTGCDQLAFIQYEGYKVAVTIVPHAPKMSYCITMVERGEP